MNITSLTYAYGWLATLLVSIGLGAFVGVAFLDASGLPRRLWNRYIANLTVQLEELFLEITAVQLAQMQGAAIACVALYGLFFKQPLVLLLVFVIAGAPVLYLEAERRTRVTKMEEQIAQWLMLLANALRANPSVGAAVEASVKLLPSPTQEHVDIVTKEMRLGVPVEKALLNMGRRIDSQTLQSALATIVISQRTGGDVPKLLEESASGLREMARLEGLIRAKTAEGKAQAFVLALVPIALGVMISRLKPGWFDPLLTSPKGYALIAVAVLAWFGALYMARRILDVEV